MKILFFDAETKRSPVYDPRNPGAVPAGGWTDYIGMGIASIAAVDSNGVPYVWLADKGECSVADAFKAVALNYDAIVGFNNNRFDDKLLGAHLNGWEHPASIDVMAMLRKATGKQYKLDALCEANGLPTKVIDGGTAPILYQQGRYSELLNYNLQDAFKLYLLAQMLQQRRLFIPGMGGLTFAPIPALGNL